MTKFTTATEAIPYIGQPCLIFDSLENKPPVEAYIEGVDIVDNKIIAERANFEPHQIAVGIDRCDHILVGYSLSLIKEDIKDYIANSNQESLDDFTIEEVRKQLIKSEFKNQLHSKSDERLTQIADKYIKAFIESDYVEMRIVDNKIEVVEKSPNKEIEINVNLRAE